MSLNADLREFVELLNSRGVEYVIVGAHSLAFHGLEEKTPVSAGETPAITTQIRQISEWQAALTINY